MKCPDCGSILTELSIQEHVLHRCFKCGGFWVDSGTANMIKSEDLVQWRRIGSLSPMFSSGGKGLCPADNSKLERFVGYEMPPNLPVKRCDRCGKWWFPADTLFNYKPAAQASIDALKRWGLTPLVRSYLLPAVTVIMMAVGTAVGVNLVHLRQQAQIAASIGLTRFSANYTGLGAEMILFKAEKPVTAVRYQLSSGGEWKNVSVELIAGYYVGKITGLAEGKNYTVSVMGKEFDFIAK